MVSLHFFNRSDTYELKLKPLGESDILNMIRQHIKADSLPSSGNNAVVIVIVIVVAAVHCKFMRFVINMVVVVVEKRIILKADGNPFYAKEIVNTLLSSGHLIIKVSVVK